MENIQRITLDIRDNQTYEQIYTKQYNKGFPIEFEITKDGEPFNLSGCAATFEMKKPDKTVIWSSCNIVDNIISIEVTEQMTIVEGKADFQITLTHGETLISTVTGVMKIDRSTIQDGDVESSSELSLITEILLQVGEIKQAAIDAKASAQSAGISASNAKTSETNAKVSETNSKTSETNSKTSETNSKKSETTATEQATLAKSYTVGGTNTRTGEDTDNSKYYYEGIKAIADETASVLAKKADLDTNGQVKLEQIPKVALDNLIKVENDTARFTLTTDDVQTGDTIKVLNSDDGSGERMYLVVDDTKLDSEEGYTAYSASVTWETIEGKPNNIVYFDETADATGIETPVELTRNDIANNLNTQDETKVLSARQGVILGSKYDRLIDNLGLVEYSEDSTYAVGDYVIYTDQLYRCHTAITIPIAWDGSNHWKAVSLLNDIQNSIIEEGVIQGTLAHYRKYANGVLEVWGMYSVEPVYQSTNQTSSTSGIFWSDPVYVPVGVEFIQVTSIVTHCYNSGIAWTIRSGYDNTGYQIYLHTMQAGGTTTRTTYIHYDIKGTWK